MSGEKFTREEIKRKIRKLKKLEVKIRFNNFGFSQDDICEKSKNIRLVWDDFFDLNDCCKKKVKYSLYTLLNMDKDELKEVISEFFLNVYFIYYKENGFLNAGLYDPSLLAQFGLPYNADREAIKKRFRELAKKYHPDTGSDSTKFIELMENYKKLLDE
ncbi:MAG: J domain-containing protein [Clostridiaceae bacterium]|nr:J domain-containing protein [Clostridiaceae bacterium]